MGFSRFNLQESLFKAVSDLGFAEPTPIQAQAIPDALLGHDIRGCAQTGTGKTCAYVIPIVDRLLRQTQANKPSALILTPTRELASQVMSVVHSLIRHSSLKTALILGGEGHGKQIHQLRSKPDIIVATTGRLLDHVQNNRVSLSSIKILVLDEADRMLDMGFLPDIKRIVSLTPSDRQTLLFSATFGPDIKHLTHQFLKNPISVELSPSLTATSENITQMVYPVPGGQKRQLLQALLELNNMTSALIFTRTKNGANKLMENLRDIGKKVAIIHSNRSQSQRQQALQGFKDQRYQLLVATDIAARGIDVKNISHVINYDVPRHPEDYVHRIGRTGRAQSLGEAFTLVSPDEEQFLRRIEGFIKKKIPRGVIPDFPYQSKPKIFSGNPTESFSDDQRGGQFLRSPRHESDRKHSSGRSHHGFKKRSFSRPPQADGERKHFSGRPQHGFEKRSFSRPPQADGERKHFSGRPQHGFGKRPFSRPPQADGERKHFSGRPHHGFEKRPFSRPPQAEGERKHFSGRPHHGFEKRPFSRPPQAEGERKHFSGRPHHGFEKRPFSRPPQAEGERKHFYGRPSSEGRDSRHVNSSPFQKKHKKPFHKGPPKKFNWGRGPN